MRLLFLGDVMGRPGREAVRRELPRLRELHAPDLVVINAENASGGVGLAPPEARELLALGADVLTGGNHTFRFKELREFMNADPRVLRPANYPPGTPGQGLTVVRTPAGMPVAVCSLLGRVFMEPMDCPFMAADALLTSLNPEIKHILVDFHAEATSEKQALAWYLDGRATLVAGTHTHVQTSDARILPGGTATITDAGMCGAPASILGMDPAIIVRKFVTGLPMRFELAKGEGRVQGLVVQTDDATGRATAITPIS
ncbi:MAG: TIGR00282 family metallophosphoesterase [Desulfovibrio sp.]|nr:TIGR00282 family metallophosphoesterase [Desulfovibrio sp.]MCA1984963.1 TIGR00282 family metallophosphoesterase [Desulfovibrio sp.]